MFITCNLNLPIQFEQFEEPGVTRNPPKLNKAFLIPWCLNVFENVIRSGLILAMGSYEYFDKLFSPLTPLNLFLIVIVAEVLVFVLWNIYFRKLYVWRDLSLIHI